MSPQIPELHNMLVELCHGKDLKMLPALTDYSVLQIISEVGTDLSKWPTEKHFTAWIGLAPGTHQSGKRHGNVKRSRNRVGILFCVNARSLARSKDIGLGGFYRRLAARRGGLVANIALARKLAVFFWRVMVKGTEFVEDGLAAYEAKILAGKQRSLCRLAKELGQTLSPMPAIA
jgi:transposase